MAVRTNTGLPDNDDYDRSKMLAPVRRVEVIDVKESLDARQEKLQHAFDRRHLILS